MEVNQTSFNFVGENKLKAKSLINSIILQEMKKLKESVVFGSQIGNRVYFAGQYSKQYPASKGFYGIITDIWPAQHHSQNAKYEVDVYDKTNKKIDSVSGEWRPADDRKGFWDKKPN